MDIVKVVHSAMVQRELVKQLELEHHFAEPSVVEAVDVAGVADAVDEVGVADADCIGHQVLRHKVDIGLEQRIDPVVGLVEMVAAELVDRTAADRQGIEVLLLHLK